MNSSHFILVHGGCHGAWSWYKLATLLKEAGYQVTTPDMGASGIDPRQGEDLKSISEYSQPLMDLMASLQSDEKAILVGHSFGGLVLTLAMERFPHKISVAVFLTAFMCGPDFSFINLLHEYHRRLDSQMDNKFFFSNGMVNPPTSFAFGKEFLATKLYQLCPPEVLTLATTMVRPLCLFRDDNYSTEVMLSKEKYGSVRRVYIVCEEDKLIKEDFQRYMIKNSPTDEVKELKGSDHMAMLSKPKELFSFLQDITKSYSR